MRYAGEGILGRELAKTLHQLAELAVSQQVLRGASLGHPRLEEVPLDAIPLDPDKVVADAQELARCQCLAGLVVEETDGERRLSADLTERGMSWARESR